MMFYLTTLDLVKILREDEPVVAQGTQDIHTVAAMEAF